MAKRKKTIAEKVAKQEQDYNDMLFHKANTIINVFHTTSQMIALYEFFKELENSDFDLTDSGMTFAELKYKTVPMLNILAGGNEISFYNDSCYFKIKQSDIDIFLSVENKLNIYILKIIEMLETRKIVQIIKDKN